METTSPSLPLCLVGEKTLGNDAMKPWRLKDHWHRMHADIEDTGVEYF